MRVALITESFLPMDLVQDGRTGYPVPPFEAAGFTDAVADLAAHPAKRAAFGAAGRKAIEGAAGRRWATSSSGIIGPCAVPA